MQTDVRQLFAFERNCYKNAAMIKDSFIKGFIQCVVNPLALARGSVKKVFI